MKTPKQLGFTEDPEAVEVDSSPAPRPTPQPPAPTPPPNLSILRTPELTRPSELAIGMHVLVDRLRGSDRPTFIDTWDDVVKTVEGETGKRIVSDEAQIWIYNDPDERRHPQAPEPDPDTPFGAWTAIPHADLIRHVTRYEGTRIKASKADCLLNDHKIAGAVKCAKARIAVSEFFANSRPGLAFRNAYATINLETGDLELYKHSPLYKCRSAYPWPLSEYTPEWLDLKADAPYLQATHEAWGAANACPTWMRLLRTWTAPNKNPGQDIAFIQELLGLSILGYATQKGKALFIIGTGGSGPESGNNGKSTFLDLLEQVIFPPKKTIQTDLSSWGQSYERTQLMNGILLCGLDESRKFPDAGLLNKIITGGSIQARYSGARSSELFSYKPIAGVIAAGQKLPELSDMLGAQRRWVFIDFKNTIDRKDVIDLNILKLMIKEEIGSIMLWILQGARRAIRQGYTIPDASKVYSQEFAEMNDPAMRFWQDCIQVEAGCKLKSTSIWRRFLQWAELEHLDTRPGKISQIGFMRNQFKPLAMQQKNGVEYDHTHSTYNNLSFKKWIMD